MNRFVTFLDRRLDGSKGPMGIVVVATVLVAVPTALLCSLLTHIERSAEMRHAAVCREHGMRSASDVEQNGKTSRSAHFCVDGRGQVFWF